MEYYIPKYKMSQLMNQDYNYSLAKVDDFERFENIIYNKYCQPMSRERADACPSFMSIGVKAILLDAEYKKSVWLVDEFFSKDRKEKISIPGGHMEPNDDVDNIEDLIRWNLIREIYEEFSSGLHSIYDVIGYGMDHHLKAVGFDYVKELDDWYYQYTTQYLSFFKVILVTPGSFICGRNAIEYTFDDHNNMELVKKYDPDKLKTFIRHNMGVGHKLKSDIRVSTHSRYSKMLPAVMDLVKNLSFD